ncbi:myb-related protein Zm1-like [Hibiscus syriacus]|uniref:Myb-related protein Zm1-like n=1 Tax=Hibiscus syriacus TaxID=106335 RepID=A0A6A2WM80_HIBSY|nr:myb-related protein Zm1-like [Hibiscus syriacus]
MAADVSYLHRVLSRYKDDRMARNESDGAKSTALITRDLLGGGGSALINMKTDQSEEFDLDLQVPNGWEKRLDLKSGKVYLQRCNSSNSSQSSDGTKHQNNRTVSKLQDLNFPPSPSKPLLNLLDETNLELKLVPSSSTNYQKREKNPIKKRSFSSSSSTLWKSSLSPSYSSSSSSIKDSHYVGDQERLFSLPVAAGCPGCLSYVMVMKHNPRCPRCNTVVPMPASKKPRLDLNISI